VGRGAATAPDPDRGGLRSPISGSVGKVFAVTTRRKLFIGLIAICLLGVIAWIALAPGAVDGPLPVVTDEADAPDPDDEETKRRRHAAQPGAAAADDEGAAAAAEETELEPIPSTPFLRVVDGPGDDAEWIAGATVLVAWGGGWATDGTVFATAAGRGTTRVILPASVPAETRIVLAAAAPMRLSFVETGTGREMSAAEVERLYADRGSTMRAELVWESVLLDGGLGAMLTELMTDGEEWRIHAPVRREGEHFVIDASPGAEAPPPSAVVVADPYGQMRQARIEQSADGLLGDVVVQIEPPDVLRRLRLIDAETSAPLAGATVFSFHQFGDDRAYARGPTVLSDGNGIVELPLAYTLGDARRSAIPSFWVVTDTHATQLQAYKVRAAEPGMVFDVQILRSAAVEGTARLPDGKPAAGLSVIVMQKGRPRFAVVAEDGSYRIEAIGLRGPSGRNEQVVLIRDAATLAITMDRVQLTPGETSHLDLGPKEGDAPAATLVGEIRFGDQPAEGALLLLRGDGGKRNFAIGRVDDKGTYVIESLIAGTYRFSILTGDPRVSDDATLESSEKLELHERDERRLDFTLPAGVIRVRVEDAAKRPLPGVGVSARWETAPGTDRYDTTRFPGYRYVSTTGGATGDDGYVLLRGLDRDRPHKLTARTLSGAKATATDVRPGAADAPPRSHADPRREVIGAHRAVPALRPAKESRCRPTTIRGLPYSS